MKSSALIARFFIAIALIVLLCQQVSAAPPDSSKQSSDKAQPSSTSITVIPLIDYTPETGFGGGLAGIISFRTSSDTTLRPSSFYGGIEYTQKKQYGIEFFPEFYFAKQTIRLYGKLQLLDYPDFFWGVGNSFSDRDKESYTQHGQNIYLIGLINPKGERIDRSFNVGIRYDFGSNSIISRTPGGKLRSHTVPGWNGGITSGLGVVFSLDSRDNVFSAARGNYLELTLQGYGRMLGSDYTYSLFSVDARKYWSVGDVGVAAAQGYFGTISGDAPFYKMMLFGGKYMMRGYYYGKYVDKNMLVVQGEWRMPVWWRFGMVAFAGMGDVFRNIQDERLADVKFSVGTGIRFAVRPEDRVNARIDFAFGKDGVEYYFYFTEAF